MSVLTSSTELAFFWSASLAVLILRLEGATALGYLTIFLDILNIIFIMSQRIKIATLQTKIEFMILSLGGKPDADKAENEFYEGEFEKTAKTIKENLKECRVKLAERGEKITLFGYQSKERILLDEEIKDMFGACEQGLSYLRDVFKRY